jgi:hypothetical protein
MQKGTLAALFRLLNRGDVMPNQAAVHDLDEVLTYITDQDSEPLMREAMDEIYAAVDAADVAQPGAFL